MKVLLVLTVGRTDVQLVVDRGRRAEFGKDRCAELHAELERRECDWRIVAAPVVKLERPEEALPPGAFNICTPKLDAVLDDLDAKGMRVSLALILETRRNPDSERGDPRAAGLVLCRRMRDRLGEGLEVVRTPLLEGSEHLEDLADSRDAIVRREVVARLDRAIRDATAKVAGGRVVVASTGGFPPLASLTEDIVRLHARAPTSVELIEVPDGSKSNPPTKDRAVGRRSVPEPVESYRARGHALDLVEAGNLLGAWGAARHLHDDEVENAWTRVVEWLSRFAASLPIPEECDIPVLRDARMGVRAALRVELALRAGDIPRAVHGTVAFFEAALWDHLRERATRHPDKRRCFKLNPAPADDLVRERDPKKLESLSKNDHEENGKRPFIYKYSEDGVDWYWIEDKDPCGVKIAKYYLKRDALTKLGQMVSSVRDLRNDVAHSEPTPELMDDARRRMREAGLWSQSGTVLAAPCVQEALRELGEQQPERLVDDLLATIRHRLRQSLA